MDEKLIEILSRAVDGDLSDVERAKLDDDLKAQPKLAAELESLERLRWAVAEVARGLEPPGELDAVVEPLRRGGPAPVRRVRPVYRWLGAAAAVVLGVTVAMEVARRNPQPTLGDGAPRRVINQDEREIFPLAPLPTAVPNENRPLGATDRLLEEAPSAPKAPEPAALEIVGPLSEEEHRVAVGAPKKTPADTADSTDSTPRDDRTPRQETMNGEAGADSPEAATEGGSRRLDAAGPGLPQAKAASAAAVREPGGKIEAGRLRSAETESGGTEIPASVGVALTLGGKKVWAGRSTPCAQLSWKVELLITKGVVVAVTPLIDGAPDPATLSCRPTGLVGVTLEGLPDGPTTGLIVAE